MDGKNVFDKNKVGGRFPTKEEIFIELEAYIKPLPDNEQKQPQDQADKSASACDWSPGKK
ncbi:MAG: hypothetical protein RQ824_11930 [bacterium]|nr:hypothetical protein [bacterium]